jgi:Lon-like ATP-dependent protease
MVTILPVTRIEEVLRYALVPDDLEGFEKKLLQLGKHMEIPKMPLHKELEDQAAQATQALPPA